jgi:hypothetical protein
MILFSAYWARTQLGDRAMLHVLRAVADSSRYAGVRIGGALPSAVVRAPEVIEDMMAQHIVTGRASGAGWQDPQPLGYCITTPNGRHRGEPVAGKPARRVRRAAWGNGPEAIPAPRPRPTQPAAAPYTRIYVSDLAPSLCRECSGR